MFEFGNRDTWEQTMPVLEDGEAAVLVFYGAAPNSTGKASALYLSADESYVLARPDFWAAHGPLAAKAIGVPKETPIEGDSHD